MSQADLADRLNQAIELVRAGRREEARAILLPLSQQYPNLEQVWLWLATASEDTQERITYLRRVLDINPNNDRARQAYTRLTGEAPAGRARTAPRPGASRGRGLDAWLIAILGLVALITVMLVISTLVAPLFAPKPTPTETLTPSITFTASVTYTPSVTPGGPTLTPFNLATLPLTWTPTNTWTPAPSSTRRPTSTPLPTGSPTPTVKPRATFTRIPTITPGGPSFTPESSTTPTPSPSATLEPGADTLTPVETATP